MINTMDKELYPTIEHLIIQWNCDGHKTAGHLTRQIMECTGIIKCKLTLTLLIYENRKGI
jgi:hypothetical protein